MGFWYVSPRRGPHRTTRQISAGTWSEIRPNYTAPVAEAMDRLMKTTPEDIAGRLLLLHGPPGTGKTSACAPWPAPGATGARSTACSTPSGSSPTSAI